MINSEKFSERLQKVIGYYNLSASAFADRIGVQRSSISHILSGRNKPSLDFVIKIIEEFPEVELYWLLNGKGVFPTLTYSPNSGDNTRKENVTHSSIKHVKAQEISKEIDRIVIFYKNGTFKNFKN